MTLDVIETTRSVRPWRFQSCGQCRDSLVGPEWSEHVSEQCVRHFWSCDSCGHQFTTTVRLSSQD
ncbi:MAG: hypothetical protein ABSG76_01585 [Xanthobacteraceae bacterium]|jgi:uncharacterized protein with PIN domain